MICLFLPTDKPFNPLINSGALLSAAILLRLVRPELDDLARKYEFVYQIFERMAGGESLQFNNSVFLAEKSSLDRYNHATTAKSSF